MSAIEKLLSISSSSINHDCGNEVDDIPREIALLLRRRNGFFAFEGALEVFSSLPNQSYSITEWNDERLWIAAYGDSRPQGLCFAQDIFGGQFIIEDGIKFFDPETGEHSLFGETLEDWARVILDDYRVLTGHPLAHDWQKINGPLLCRHRLVPLAPFVLGGSYSLDNLFAMEAAKSMRLRGDLARQLRDLPDGAQVIYQVTE